MDVGLQEQEIDKNTCVGEKEVLEYQGKLKKI